MRPKWQIVTLSAIKMFIATLVANGILALEQGDSVLNWQLLVLPAVAAALKVLWKALDVAKLE